jgi:heme/copper-type cytochrome/quinol oxidase subunit 3
VATRSPDKSVVAIWAFIVSEAGFFLILIAAYLVFNVSTRASASVLDARTTAVFTGALLASSVTVHMAEKAYERGARGLFLGWLFLTIGLGTAFMAGQGREYAKLLREGLAINSSLFASTFFTLTGFHGLHVTVGLIALAIVFGLALDKDFKTKESSALKSVSLYWHFVDVVWIAVFSIVYLRGAA